MPAAPIPRRSGLALPAVRLNGGYFAARSTYDVAWGDLIIAAFVPFGGRFMRRSVGSQAPNYLMDVLDNMTAAMLRDAVSTAVAAQCPHIRVIDVVAKAVAAKTMSLTISFTVAPDRDTVTERTVQLDRHQVGNALRTASVLRGLA